MPIVVGVSADDAGADAVALGAAVSRLMGEGVVLAHVQPPTIDYPSIGKVDAEWTDYLRTQAHTTLAKAREALAPHDGVTVVDSVTVANSAVSRGLLEVAREAKASVIVVGPGLIRREARVSLGSTAHSLVHGSDYAIAVAPEGYRLRASGRIGRLVVGFRDRDPGVQDLRWSLGVANAAGIDVEMLSVIIRVTHIDAPRLGGDPERAVLQVLKEQQQHAQERAREELGVPVSGAVVEGGSAEQALEQFDWRADDLFVLGSSRYGAVSRVVLGDLGKKLVRASAVPVLIRPRND